MVASNLQRFNDNVTADLNDGISVSSSRLGSMASFKSSASVQKRIENIKHDLQAKAVSGSVMEDEFRDAIYREFPLLRSDKLDHIVNESAKKPNRPDKIFDQVIPKYVSLKDVRLLKLGKTSFWQELLKPVRASGQ
jgi:hypothetical protein